MEKGKSSVFLIIGLFFVTMACLAQGDGPRAELFAPIGVWGINPKYLNLEQNLLPAGNILVEGANFKIDVFPTTFLHTFAIGENYARVLAMLNPGSGKATANINPQIPAQIDELSFDGFSDGFVAFELGILNTPAVNVVEFAKLEPKVRVTGQFRLWYSGSYDSDKLVNLGTNRFALEFRSTLLVPLFKSLEQKQTWIEFVPKLQFFTDNNDPSRSSTASKIEQESFFMIESHLSHNFTKKLWASVDLGYQYGGSTTADGVSDDNTINFMGGGASLGYQILPYLGAYSSYGSDFFNGQRGVNAEMIRLSVVFTYANLKKLTKQTN
jgi:hypothetical protein